MKDVNLLGAHPLFLRRKRKEETCFENVVGYQKQRHDDEIMKSRISTNESFKDGSEQNKEFEYDRLVRRSYNDDKITSFFKSKKISKNSLKFGSPRLAIGSGEKSEKIENNLEKPEKTNNSNSDSSNFKKINFFESPSKNSNFIKLKNNYNNNSPSNPLIFLNQQNFHNNINYASPSSINSSSKKKRLEKDIKDYFREFKLSSKTLMTLQKGNFINSPGSFVNRVEFVPKRNSSNQNTPSKINKIVKNLPVQSPKTNEKNLKEIDRVLNSISMKERFEELLKRELLLPSMYKLLLLQFKALDEIITHLKFDKKLQTGLDNINSIISSCKKGKSTSEKLKEIISIPISQDEFGKMLTVAPYIFIYSFLKGILAIDIPIDSERRIQVR